MDEKAQAVRAQTALRQLSPEQVVAIHHVVRQQILADLHDEAIQVARGAVEQARVSPQEPRRQELEAQSDARLSTVIQERDAARNGRALAQQLLVSLLRQLLPGREPVSLCSLGVCELDAYRPTTSWLGTACGSVACAPRRSGRSERGWRSGPERRGLAAPPRTTR